MAIWNPYLPMDEYVPDTEPHVFGDRVYIYGSHDKEMGDRFCMRDYVVYSAPVNDLSQWTCHGVSYKKSQDPRSKDGKEVDMYAPDCVRGNDGRYYLYYFAAGPNTKAFGPMSVAVADVPQGPFTYLGDIQYPDGKPMTKFLTNDPAVINDNGRIWLYYGWGLGHDFRSKLLAPLYNTIMSKLFMRPVREIKNTKPSILSCAVVELEDDMITVKTEPKAVLDSKTTADPKSELYHHAFYEAASIRKFGDLFYLVYSSGENCELAYATSKYPDHGFTYRGVIISNSDIGYQGNQTPLAAGGTIHGGIECINGTYYVFYHRCTNNTNFSRQTCAEPIEIQEDGTIPQVEITTQGMNKAGLPAKGTWPATLCCNLFHEKTCPVQGNGHQQDQPNISWDGQDHMITAITNGTWIGYKYFEFTNVSSVKVIVRGGAGEMQVITKATNHQLEQVVGSVSLHQTREWCEYILPMEIKNGVYALYFKYIGEEKIDFLEFEIQ